MHLVIDGYGGDKGKMWDQELLREFLVNYPDNLGMNPDNGTQGVGIYRPHAEDSGISGFVIIAESHISVHTFPHREYVNIDIFSCKSFDSDQALADARDLFQLEEVKTWLLERGLEWADSRQGLSETQQQRSGLRGGG